MTGICFGKSCDLEGAVGAQKGKQHGQGAAWGNEVLKEEVT